MHSIRNLYLFIRDMTVDYPFIRANLGLTRKQIIACWIKRECY